jgi:RpiR family transcriptional regulator, carbohydrate utilization regulator
MRKPARPSPAISTMIERIEAAMPSLPASEARVAALVLQDPGLFSSLPVLELSKRSGVSTPTVVRFCRSMGFKGLSDFKLKLAAHSRVGVPFIHKAVNVQDSTEQIANKVIDNAAAAFVGFRDQLSSGPIDASIKALAHTIQAQGRIEFYGVGNSGIVALDGQHKFFRLGCNTVAYSDGHMQVMAATLAGPNDCVVIISNSGLSRDLLDAAEILKKRKATVIAITTTGSPLAKLANHTISADHHESYDQYSPMVSRMLHLLVIDILVTGVAVSLGPSVQAKLSAIKANLKEKRYRA